MESMILFTFLAYSLFGSAPIAQAATGINRQLTYQAKLLDSTGLPVSDGTYAVKFSIYDAASGGTRLWSASGTTATPLALNVSVTNGLFTVYLGDTSVAGGTQNPLDDTILWNTDNLFLGVTIAADAEMTPRKRLSASPYAFNTERLQGMFASSSNIYGGSSLFTLNQASNTAATATRTTLEVRSQGTSNANDFLIQGINDSNTPVFTVNRQGNVTATNAVLSNVTTTNVFATNASATTLNANTSTIASLNTINAFGQNATFTNLNTSNFNPTNLTWTNGTGTNTTSTNLFATTASATTLTALNLSSNNATILGGTALLASSTITNLTATNATFTSATATTWFVSNLVDTSATLTSATATNLFSTNGSITNFTAVNVTGTSATFTNLSVATFNPTNLTWTNGTGTNTTSTNLFATTASATTLTALNLSTNNATILGGTALLASSTITNLTATNATFTSATATTWFVSNLVGTSATLTDATTTDLFSTNGSITNFTAVNVTGTSATFTNLSVATFNPTNLTWTNGTGTNTTSTNLFATTASATNLTALNLNTNFATASQVTTTNLFATTASSSNLFAATSSLGAANVTNLFGQSATFTNATATTLFAGTVSGTTLSANTLLFNSASGNGLILTNATFTNLNVGILTPTNLTWSNATGTNTTSTNLFATTASATTLTALNLTANNATILSGTALLSSSTITNLTWINATGTNTTSTNLFATTASATTLDATTLRGTNIYAGTTTYGGGLHPDFAVNGGDIFAQDNIGAASSIYTNGDFVIGTGTTRISDGEITKTNGDLLLNISGGHLAPATDQGVTLGSSTQRFDANLGNSTTTNATATTFFATTASATSLIALGLNANNVTATNATLTNLSVNNLTLGNTLNLTNVTWSNATGTNTTSTNLFATTASATTLTALNLTSNNATILGGTALLASSTITNLTATNATFTSATATTWFVSNLVGTSATFTAATTTSLFFSTASGTNFAAINVTGTNATFTNLGIATLNVPNLSWTLATGTETTTTNLFAATASATNLTALNLNTNFATASQATTTNLFATTASATTFNANTSTIANLNSINSFSQGSTSTNLFASAASATTLTALNLNANSVTLLGGTALLSSSTISNLTWSLATGTETTSTNLFATTASATTLNANTSTIASLNTINAFGQNATFTNLNTSNFNPTNINGTNATLTNVTTTNFAFTNASGSIATTTNLIVTSNAAIGLATATEALDVNGNIRDLIAPSSTFSLKSRTVFGAGTAFSEALYVYDRHVYILDAIANKLDIIDTSNLSAPVLVGSTTTNGTVPRAIHVDGRYAYVADSAGVTVIDVSNSSAPIGVGQVSISLNTPTMAISGRYLYVTSRNPGRVFVIDIAQPTKPTLAFTLNTALGLREIAIQGNYAYLVNNSAGVLNVVDISNPLAATIISTSTAVGAVRISAASNGFAYALDNTNSKLDVFNVSNPTNPILAASTTLGVGGYDMTLQGRYVYVVDAASGLSVVDIANPNAPQVVTSTTYPGMIEATRLTASGRYLYIGNATSVDIVDLKGIEVNGLMAHSAELGALQVLGSEIVANQLTVGGGMQVGVGGIQSLGAISATSVSSVAMYANNATIGTLNISTLNPTSLTWTDATGTNTTSTNLFATTASATTLTALNLTANNATILSGTALLSSSTITNLTWINATGTNTTSSNLFATTASATNLFAATSSLGAANVTNLFGQSATFTNATATSLFASTVSGTTLSANTLLFNNASGNGLVLTNVTGTNATFTNLNVGTLTPTNLTWINATGTNTTSTNLFATTASATTLDATTLRGTNIYAGTTTYGGGLHPDFAVNGGDIFAQDNIGAASSVYTNGDFVIGTGTTRLSDGQITKTNGDLLLNIAGGHLAPTSDQGVTLGSSTRRFNANLGDSTTTNATTTNFFATTASATALTALGLTANNVTGTNATFTNLNVGTLGLTNLTWSNATGSNTTSSNLFATTASATTLTALALTANNATILGGTAILSSSTITNLTAGTATATNALITQNMAIGLATATQALDVNGNIRNVLASGTTFSISASTSFAASNFAEGMAVYDRHVYILDFILHTLSVVDTSNLAGPTLVGSTTTNGTSPQAIDTDGRYVYIVDSTGFNVIDVSNSSAPIQISNTSIPVINTATMALSGRYAYVTARSPGRVFVIDIADPFHPAIVGTLNTVAGLRNISILGNYAYIVNNTAGILGVVDISNPVNPVQIGTSTAVGVVRIDAASNGFAYGMDQTNNNLDVFNVSNPTNPTLVVSSTFGILPYDMTLQGRYIYTVDAGTGLSVIDIANPNAPVLIASTTLPGATQLTEIQASGRYLYLGDSHFLDLVDLKGIEVNGIMAHSAEFGSLQILGNEVVTNQLTVGGGMQVGIGGIRSLGGISATSVTSVTLNVENATMTNVTTTNFFATNASATNLTLLNVSSNNATFTSVTTTNQFNSNLVATAATATSLFATTASATNLTALNFATNFATASQVTTTNIFATTASATTLTALSLNANSVNILAGTAALTGLTWTNATGTNTTSTSLFATTASATTLTVGGAFSSNGTTTLGDAAGDNIIFNGRANSNLLPSAANTYDLGSMALPWNNIYASSVSATTMVAHTLNVNGNISMGTDVTVVPSATTTNANAVGTVTGPGGGSTKLIKVNNLLYATGNTNNKFNVYDVTIPSAPVLKYSSTSVTNFPSPWYMAADGKYVYVSNLYSNSISVFDAGFATSSQPKHIVTGAFGSTGTIALVADGRYLYKLDASGSIDVLDGRSIPTDTQTTSVNLAASSTYSSSAIADMVKDGNFLYIISGGGQFSIVDVTNPMAPVETSSTTINGPWDIKVQNGKAYISSFANNRISVYDVHDPWTPTLLATLNSADFVGPSDMGIAGHFLYAANFNSSIGIGIYDIFSSATPTHIGYTGFGNYGFSSIIPDGKYLYVYDAGNNLITVLSVPSVNTIAMEAGSIETGNLSVMTSVKVGQKVTVTGDISTESNFTVRGNALINNLFATMATATSFVATTVSTTNLTVGGQLVCLADGTNCSVGQTLSASSTASTPVGAETEVLVVTSTPSFASNQVWISADLKVANSNVTTASTFTVRVRRGTSCTGGVQVGVDRTVDVPVTSSGDISVGFVDAPNTTSATGYRICVLATGGTPTAEDRSEVVQIVRAGSDLAEVYYSDDATLAPGEVVSADPSSFDKVARSTSTYDRTVLGVVSTNPGSVLSSQPKASGTPVLVALSGRVPVNVSVTNGDIDIGDPLVAGDAPGFAMKATRPGQVIGYALQDATTTGSIEMFVKVGFDASSIFTDVGLDLGPTSTASAATTTVDSWGLTLRGSAWDSVSSTVTSPQFTINNDVIDATNSQISIKNTSGSTVFTLNQAGDLSIAGRLFPSRRGVPQSDYYLFLDDTLGPGTSTYIATNADGWQANDSYDFAERYYSPESLESGDLVTMSKDGQLHIQKTTDKGQVLMGIVSTKPGFVTGRPATDTYAIALSGRVPTKVSAMNGAIAIGDPIAPSSIPGVGMKATQPGPIAGYALEAYDGTDVGKIEVFVNMGWNGDAKVSIDTGSNASTVSAPSRDTYQGFALVKAGDKKVTVTFPSLKSYPNVQANPRGFVIGGFSTDDYTDTSFTINLAQSQDRDVRFSWTVVASKNGDQVFNSDGTYGMIDPLTGATVDSSVSTTQALTTTPPTSSQPMVTSIPVDQAPSSVTVTASSTAVTDTSSTATTSTSSITATTTVPIAPVDPATSTATTTP